MSDNPSEVYVGIDVSKTQLDVSIGKDGQFCIVLPEQDAVIAITANARDMQAELNVVWDKLLPAFSDAPQAEAPRERAALQATIARLKASR